MPLLNVTVGGMRNLGETHIELDGITAIVSENNYGKTNLMTALSLASLYVTASPKVRISFRWSRSFRIRISAS